MAQQKFTVFLIPDEEGYQAIVPHYGGITWGSTPEEAIRMAHEALALLLETQAEVGGADDPVPYHVHASHVVVGEVEVEVPDILMGEINERKAATRVQTTKARI